jgi:hypothetical protein
MVLEQRWTSVSPEQYAREAKLAGDESAFTDAGPGVALIRPAGQPAEFLALLEAERGANPDEPLWSAIHAMVVDGSAVRIEFVPRAVPRLLPVAGPDEPPGSAVQVSCHLYHEPIPEALTTSLDG